MKKETTKEKLDGTEPVEPEFEFHPERMKRVPREKMKFAKPGDTDPRNCKIRITIYLDGDILDFFKKRAEQPNAAPYQTQINNALREYMGQEPTPKENYQLLVQNDAFIEAIAKRLKQKVKKRPA